MLSDRIRILDLDASVARQKPLIKDYKSEVIDLKGIGPAVRMWMSKAQEEKVRHALDPSSRNAVTFLGSGDFHHLSNTLIGQFNEPICLIVFDLHPDWDILPPRAACGSWVSSVMKNKNISKCLLIGVSSEDISGFWIHSADLQSLKADRVEIYPYSHRPTRVFLREVPENISLEAVKGFLSQRIYWNQLKAKDLRDQFRAIIERLPVKDVYISLDKDCLSNKFALTNWEEGQLSLNELLSMLRMIREKLNIVGMDITGDYSPVVIKGLVKRIIASFDHPKGNIAAELPDAYVLSVNAETNREILNVIGVK